jgi:hypothetical protein
VSILLTLFCLDAGGSAIRASPPDFMLRFHDDSGALKT